MRIKKDIDELLREGVISNETAEGIRAYYREKQEGQSSRLLTVFGALGALLVGLGIILLIAHNWDNFSRSLRTILAFLPLVLAQGFCFYTLWKRPDNRIWVEAGSIFLFLSVGGCISLISQIYHIKGELSSFLYTWLLLGGPIIYLMGSRVVSMLYLASVTWYGFAAMNHHPLIWGELNPPQLHWLFFLGALPFFIFLYRKHPDSNFTTFHNWIIPLSLCLMVTSTNLDQHGLFIRSFMPLFGGFFLIGKSPPLLGIPLWKNGYRILGSVGTVVVLLVSSFGDYWGDRTTLTSEVIRSPAFFVLATITLLSTAFLILHRKKGYLQGYHPMAFLFLLFLLGFMSPTSEVFMSALYANLLLLLTGVWMIKKGTERQDLGILNYGLLIVGSLVVCRFFDDDISFVLRGLFFVLAGIGFFVANIHLIRKKKSQQGSNE